ncbi:ODoRant response abnormal family member (odr-3) [Reticulomyxa filosa]|uniref:ODoRant response abnormal family member (Odr-3) n=1 Tax=Reticulomyxa filosa TaxID=46433 RepID=X6P1L4_RETFI|nr:ODoRant response abnormal family member (odr-3) [Reticulomyxa filosa]|eukprot:ETO32033.1 ODoRant response abnormal family member (odr-3) [Reticulomyxa filosa]
MGCCLGSPRDNKDREVQREIEKDKAQEARVHKLLLLGAGGSGKSTFFKQLKQLHGDGYSARDKEGYRKQIYGQVIESMQILIRQCKLVTGELSDEEHEVDERTENLREGIKDDEIEQYKIDEQFAESCKYIQDLANGSAVMNEQLAGHVKLLWTKSTAIRKMFDHRNKICVPDSTQHFLDEIDIIARTNFDPATTDILLVRYRTTGMTEKEFKINGAIFKICDVGGQRSERKKWINFFDGVTAVLFVVSLACYDEVPFEDVSDLDANVELGNNMLESIKVFEETLAFSCFEKTGFILFFNKADLMREKIKQTPITSAFPNYKGPQEFQPAVDYIQNFFIRLNTNSERETLLSVSLIFFL